ncbi:MAG: hypothetical protein GY836_17965 [Herbaspirillum sp.]|uniref:hypothetical protein n=1 Tax=Herbaspirillum sp. TaxID=1890675 RepID=UPI00258B5134|nr:hypothetical protein [Herbaspirillum sp.]MCP4557295.1 hypothetical protein [Herbaspirillum sp.]
MLELLEESIVFFFGFVQKPSRSLHSSLLLFFNIMKKITNVFVVAFKKTGIAWGVFDSLTKAQKEIKKTKALEEEEIAMTVCHVE